MGTVKWKTLSNPKDPFPENYYNKTLYSFVIVHALRPSPHSVRGDLGRYYTTPHNVVVWLIIIPKPHNDDEP